MKRRVNKATRLVRHVRNDPIFDGLGKTRWFKGWIRRNMHIYNEFERYALELREKGRRSHYSARAIIHRMRWDTLFEDDSGQFKIQDHCTPYMARLVMIENPQLKGMFRITKKN